MHHHSDHPTQNWNLWRNILYIWTAAIALILDRTTSLGLVGAVGLGFLIAAALVWITHLVANRRSGRGPRPT